MFNIDNHEKEILAVGYKNKTIATKDKCNQLNRIYIQSLLGTNNRMLLSQMDKSYSWLGKTNQHVTIEVFQVCLYMEKV